jgi:short-subunit dehydrogenase
MSELAGKRALVTGASSGIGARIARELAARGVTLVLTARREQLLTEVAAECGALGVTVDTIVADLGLPETAERLWNAATAKDPVDICINNAGFGYFRTFTDADHQRDAELLQLNITSLVSLSRSFVEHRKNRDGRAYLVNIASIGAYQSVPNFAVYAASKAFVRNFTEALHDELRGTPVSATCICPGGTKTEFHGAAGAGNYGWLANKTMMSAEAVAKITLRAMEKGKRNVIPGLMNKLSCWSVRLVPRRFASWMAGRVLGKPRREALPSRTSAA